MNTASAVSKHAIKETKACVYKTVHYQPLCLMQQVNWLILGSISEALQKFRQCQIMCKPNKCQVLGQL